MALDGYSYPLGAHPGFVLSSAAVICPFKTGVTVQVIVPTTANSISFVANPYSGVIQSVVTTPTAACVGVAVSAPTTGQFCWLQVGGLASCTTGGTVVIGCNVIGYSTVAGGVSAYAAGAAEVNTQTIGVVSHVATTTNKSTVYLMLPCSFVRCRVEPSPLDAAAVDPFFANCTFAYRELAPSPKEPTCQD